MTLKIEPCRLRGAVTPPPSKSAAHRAIICASLCAQGQAPSRIENISLSEDISATIDALGALGADIAVSGSSAAIKRGAALEHAEAASARRLFCRESGSTLRFMIPAALLSGGGSFFGEGRLMQRPLTPYFEVFGQKGIACIQDDEKLVLEGMLTPGAFSLRGDVSSQFVSGLLMVLPLLGEDSVVEMTSPLQSKPYVAMTLSEMEAFGVRIRNESFKWFYIPGGQRYIPADRVIEADYSQAAFFIAANALGSDIAISGLNVGTLQGDRMIETIIRRMEEPGSIEIDASDIPDLVPITALLASLRHGRETVICGAARLRIKESDRLKSTCAVLSELGATIEEMPEGLRINGRKSLEGGTVHAYNDHRIAMMAAIASTVCSAPVELFGAECVAKSYPDFWEVFSSLGGICGISKDNNAKN